MSEGGATSSNEKEIGEPLPDLPGQPTWIDDRALYLTASYDCGEKHACVALHELLHEGAKLAQIEDPMLRDGATYVDGELLVGVPFSWFGPTSLSIVDRKTGARETIVLWPSYDPPRAIARDGQRFVVARYDPASDRSEVFGVRTGPKRLLFTTKGQIESLSVVAGDLEYRVGSELRRRPKIGGVETVAPVDPRGGLDCRRLLLRSVPGGTKPEIIDDGFCRALNADAHGVYWISEEMTPALKVFPDGAYRAGEPTGKTTLRTLGTDGRPRTLGTIAAGDLWLSAQWVYVIGKAHSRRVRR